ncbi:hypothetical protein OHC33_004116 [Knufia fluminis]|uniref:Uncharacterized protein n=1 Tax=Knufia fluminis TaxID=191047 RepID=A0AAN8I6D1_9EURO|nr:hypothetical protein OHC33_004116 [Knufia fluminis]
MQTPQKTAPQSARRSSKQHKPQTEQKAVQSDNDAYLVAPQEGEQTSSRKKRQPRKKSNARKNGVQSDVGEFQDHEPIHRHSSLPGKPKSTPAKAIKSDAYAGPTFHQSPAASALPMPSFFSKSFPNNTGISTIAETTDGSSDSREKLGQAIEEKRDPTPLDWMFNAARQAKGTPNGASPARMLSPPFGSPAASPGGRREEGAFPFELDEPEQSQTTFSTPFSQRLAASRTPQSTYEGGQSMTEEERKAKTAALKKALMNNASPSPTQLGSPFKEDNPFNARNASPNNNFPPRHTSNPAVPTYQNGYTGNQYYQNGPSSPNRNFTGVAQYNPNSRPPSSNLRNVYDPAAGGGVMSPAITTLQSAVPPPRAIPLSPPATAPQSRISTARSPEQPRRPLNFEAIYGATSGSRPSSEGNTNGHNSNPSLEQGLDDLKKALNMDFFGRA